MAVWVDEDKSSWNEPERREFTCPTGFRTAVEEAYGAIVQSLSQCALRNPCLTDLLDCIANSWSSIRIDCNSESCKDIGPSGARVVAVATQHSRTITFCSQYANATQWNNDSLQMNLLHELIHLCGGTEIDAYLISWFCYEDRGGWQLMQRSDPYLLVAGEFCRTALRPSSDGNLRGKWVIYDNLTGELYCTVFPGSEERGILMGVLTTSIIVSVEGKDCPPVIEDVGDGGGW